MATREGDCFLPLLRHRVIAVFGNPSGGGLPLILPLLVSIFFPEFLYTIGEASYRDGESSDNDCETSDFCS